ncbi:hypothetical protein MHYP_G00038450 [Metynnis hypsauchen]
MLAFSQELAPCNGSMQLRKSDYTGPEWGVTQHTDSEPKSSQKSDNKGNDGLGPSGSSLSGRTPLEGAPVGLCREGGQSAVPHDFPPVVPRKHPSGGQWWPGADKHS